MLQELLQVTGVDFTPRNRFGYNDAKAALFAINKLFPNNRKFIGGSVAINGEGRDIDIFIRGGEEDIKRAKELGFKASNERYPVEDFCSLRYQGINLIFLTSNKEYQRVEMAVHVCCHLADYVDVEKDIRVAVHEAIRNFKKPLEKKKKANVDNLLEKFDPQLAFNGRIAVRVVMDELAVDNRLVWNVGRNEGAVMQQVQFVPEPAPVPIEVNR